MDTIDILTKIITPIAALVGLTISVLNYWRANQLSKVVLRVTMQICIIVPKHDRSDYLSIEIVNLGNFPVTITGIYFSRVNSQKGFFMNYSPFHSAQLPNRLEPRDKIHIIYPILPDNIDDLRKIRYAQAMTAYGYTGYSTKKTTKTAIKNLENLNL